jgi:hypothetical protein
MAADNPCVRIICLWDRARVNDTALYRVQHDDNPDALATYTEGINRWSKGELNMADPQTLISFVVQGRSEYPSPYTFLAVVDHGNGWSTSGMDVSPTERVYSPSLRTYPHGAFAFDDHVSGAYLTTADLERAFRDMTNQNENPVDVLYFDACLVAMIENLYPLRNSVRYVVASESEVFASYPYDKYMYSITADTQPADLARAVVQHYHDSLSGTCRYPRQMAAIDLAEMEAIGQAVRNLRSALQSVRYTYRDQIRASYDSAQKFDSNLDLRLTNSDSFIDLYDFARWIAQRIPAPVVSSAAQAVMEAIGDDPGSRAILAEQHLSDIYWQNGAYWNLENAHGISIYMPVGERDWLLDFYDKQELSFVTDTGWDDLVRSLVDMLKPPVGPTPVPVDPANRPGPLFLCADWIYAPLILK